MSKQKTENDNVYADISRYVGYDSDNLISLLKSERTNWDENKFKDMFTCAFIIASAVSDPRSLKALLSDQELSLFVSPTLKDGGGTTALATAFSSYNDDAILLLLLDPKLKGQHDLFARDNILESITRMMERREKSKVFEILEHILSYEDVPLPSPNCLAILFIYLNELSDKSLFRNLFERLPSQESILRVLLNFTENAPMEQLLKERSQTFRAFYELCSEKTKDSFFKHVGEDIAKSENKERYAVVFAREGKKELSQKLSEQKSIAPSKAPSKKL